MYPHSTDQLQAQLPVGSVRPTIIETDNNSTPLKRRRINDSTSVTSEEDCNVLSTCVPTGTSLSSPIMGGSNLFPQVPTGTVPDPAAMAVSLVTAQSEMDTLTGNVQKLVYTWVLSGTRYFLTMYTQYYSNVSESVSTMLKANPQPTGLLRNTTKREMKLFVNQVQKAIISLFVAIADRCGPDMNDMRELLLMGLIHKDFERKRLSNFYKLYDLRAKKCSNDSLRALHDEFSSAIMTYYRVYYKDYSVKKSDDIQPPLFARSHPSVPVLPTCRNESDVSTEGSPSCLDTGTPPVDDDEALVDFFADLDEFDVEALDSLDTIEETAAPTATATAAAPIATATAADASATATAADASASASSSAASASAPTTAAVDDATAPNHPLPTGLDSSSSNDTTDSDDGDGSDDGDDRDAGAADDSDDDPPAPTGATNKKKKKPKAQRGADSKYSGRPGSRRADSNTGRVALIMFQLVVIGAMILEDFGFITGRPKVPVARLSADDIREHPWPAYVRNGSQIISQTTGSKILRKIKMNPNGSLPLGMPADLKHLYRDHLVPLREDVLQALGPGWEMLAGTECFLLDCTDGDQRLHVDGVSESGIAMNIVVMVEGEYQPEFNIVPGSHQVMSVLFNAENNGTLTGPELEVLKNIAASLYLQRLKYKDGYPILSLEHALHGGVSTGGKWVMKYHCMFRRSGINSLNPSHLPPTNPVVCEILKEGINNNSLSVVKNSEVY